MFRIHKVAVLGSGTMGVGIACHLANTGLSVLMLDVKSWTGNPNERAASALNMALSADPSPLYVPRKIRNIQTGNFDDDLKRITDYDWIIEAVVEDIDIKLSLLSQVDRYRKETAIVSSNTSGIPITQLTEGKSDAFKAHFLGTHFFNPVRYLELLEIVPTEYTNPEATATISDFGENILGKRCIICRDTPAFIANRIGVYNLAHTIEIASALGLSASETDQLTGLAIGRPKTGTFRLIDMVGLDTADLILNVMRAQCPDDDQLAALEVSEASAFLLSNNSFGVKSGKGFYHKTREKDEKGQSVVQQLDLQTKAYVPIDKSNLESLKLSRQIENVRNRIKTLFLLDDAGGQLIKRSFGALFAYVSQCLPDIANSITDVDNALKAGFGWQFGPFEYWDIIGLEQGIEAAELLGFKVGDWVREMIADGQRSFYLHDGSTRQYYDFQSRNYIPLQGSSNFVILDDYRHKRPVLKNDELTVHDIGNQVLCAEFRGKANMYGEGVIRGLHQTIDLAESGDWRGLVVGNNARHFTVGANLMLIGMMAFQKQFDELETGIRLFQDLTMRCRYAAIPVVAATQGYVFGGGCEMIMHCDMAVCAAESYIGLVEVGAGLLPGAGGTKEFALRASDEFTAGGVHIPQLIDRLRTIAMAKVSTSAEMAYDYGYLNSKDEICIQGRANLGVARERVIGLSEKGYLPPLPRQNITVLGRTGLGALYAAINELKLGDHATDYDLFIAKKIAYILCGGDLTGPQEVSEQYLLDIEREGFLQLCGEEKTLARIQYMLENNKPLRN